MGVPAEGVLAQFLLPLVGGAGLRRAGRAARGIRGIFRWIAGLLGRWMGRRAARGVGWVLVAGLICWWSAGCCWTVRSGLPTAASPCSTPRPAMRHPAGHRVAVRAAPIRWCRGTPSASRDATSPAPARPPSRSPPFTGPPALEPIRAYAGHRFGRRRRGPGPLAVGDLQRAGGFDRKYLLVAGTTGTGWVDPAPSTAWSTDRWGHRQCRDAVLLSAVMGVVHRRPDPGPAGGSGHVRRRVRGVERPAGRRPAEAVAVRRQPRVVLRRGRLQRRVRPAQPHRRRAVRRSAQLQHPVPGVPGRPRPRQPRGGAGLPGRANRPVHRRPEPADPAGPAPWDGTRVLYLAHPSDPISGGAPIWCSAGPTG